MIVFSFKRNYLQFNEHHLCRNFHFLKTVIYSLWHNIAHKTPQFKRCGEQMRNKVKIECKDGICGIYKVLPLRQIRTSFCTRVNHIAFIDLSGLGTEHYFFAKFFKLVNSYLSDG